MTFQERVLNALPLYPRESTIAATAAELELKDAERARLTAALHRLKSDGLAQNNGKRGPASAWSRVGPAREHATAVEASPASGRALAPAVPPAEPFQAAIDHRGRIAVCADGIAVQIRPADALELLAFLQQMEDVIAFQAKGARK